MEIIQYYLSGIEQQFKTGIAREHAYRPDLRALLENLAPNIIVTNEPARIDCGAPDFILTTKKHIPLGYIEAKDISKDLHSKNYKEQFDRYKASLSNLIITDYLNFQRFVDGELVAEVRIADVQGNAIKPLPENFEAFERLIKDFTTYLGQTINSASKLSKMMAGKAKLLANVIEQAVSSDEDKEADSTLKQQMKAFREILITDIKANEFADVYAQTVAYGMFAARLHDETLDDFSRQEAAELIPKSNPFLRSLFGYIAGPDLDDRIKWLVDALADIFRATNVAELLKDFGKSTQRNDPFLHFYETFLAEYDKKLRKARGVWYTPEPVVDFIVRAVDDILKTDFGLKDGLADNSKTTIVEKVPVVKGRGKTRGTRYVDKEKEVHKVQILDPACGTGTFLAAVIKHIHQKYTGQQGIWESYVKQHLIPRLHGFEILMASYAMAHLKLEMLLRETGFTEENNQRLKIYLTNSLEEYHPDTGTLFADWLAKEASEADHIKRDAPVMVVMGNPPYSGHSSNKGEWIEELIKDYKQEPGGGKLKEKNPKWLNDDYVKFIRYGQHFVEKNSEGVLAYINNHSFLDNPTFRGMRWHLLKTFDKIYIIDLHGNSKKKETCPDGSPDKNVFDIQQGVSINVFVKTGKKEKDKLGDVFHCDVYGERKQKYQFLWDNGLASINFDSLRLIKPQYYFVKKDYKAQVAYEKGFSLVDFFPVNSLGIATARDKFCIEYTKDGLKLKLNNFLDMEIEDARLVYGLGKDVRDWSVKGAKDDLVASGVDFVNRIVKLDYRPFDKRFTYYTGNSRGFHCMPRNKVMCNFFGFGNLGLSFNRQIEEARSFTDVFIFGDMIQLHSLSIKEANSVAPLYLYAENSHGDEQLNNKIVNINRTQIDEFIKRLHLNFEEEKLTSHTAFSPIDLLDYIYAVLYSLNYREKYKEFLKTDYPRIPYPTNKDNFWQLVKLGGELRQLHLMESDKLGNYITQYPVSGDNVVTRPIGKNDFEITDSKSRTGRVWINGIQYFDSVPELAWNFYIGGYQPAQKWLKDRKGRTLDVDDIFHYQKIIVALSETDRVMHEIDKVLVI